MYKLFYTGAILRLTDNVSISTDPNHRDYIEFLAWKAAGNVPIPADPAPTPPDLSDSANLEKTLQALMLCIAQVGGLTIPQAKAMFKQKFNSLP